MYNCQPEKMKFWNKIKTKERALFRVAKRHRILPTLHGVYTKSTESVAAQAQIPSWAISQFANRNDVWAITQGSGVTVAVLDTGCSLSNPDLTPNLVGGYNVINPNQDPTDSDGHGTHCAAIIAAQNNDIGNVGIAPQAKVMPVKVFNNLGFTSDRAIARGIKFAVDNGADIISMSLGGALPSSNILIRALEYAVENNVLLFAASGNDSSSERYAEDAPFFNFTNPNNLEQNSHTASTIATYDKVNYPAKNIQVISVGSYFYSASLNQNILSAFTSCGTTLDILAPGDRIWSAVDATTYYLFSGTSMACPFAAGVAALLCSYAKSIGKTLNRTQILALLGSSSLSIANSVSTRYGSVTLDTDNNNQIDSFWVGQGAIDLNNFNSWKNAIDQL